MKVGLDYWQVISHYPEYFGWLANRHLDWGDEVHVISAVGHNREDESIAEAVSAKGVTVTDCHMVIFDHPSQSPELKLAKCKELGIDVFFDDRDDVCRLLGKNGITTFRVTRKDNSTYDLSAERK